MDSFNREELELLLSQRRSGPCISIFMPTGKGWEKDKENSIRFKNQIGKAEDFLEARGIEATDSEQILEPAKRLIEDSYFWVFCE